MNEKNEWQGIFKELAYSAIYVGNEVLYVFSMSLELSLEDLIKALIELLSMPGEVFKELFGEPALDMNIELGEITDKDIACRPYGPQTARMPK